MFLKTFELAKKHINHWFLFLVFIDDIVFTLLESNLMVKISSGSFDTIPYYLVLKLGSPLISNFFIRPLITNLAYQVQKNFEAEATKKYDSMTFSSKNNKPATMFWEKSSAAGSSVFLMIDWGIQNIMNLVGTFCAVIWTFYQKDLLKELLAIVTISGLLYYIFIRHKQNAFSALNKKIKKVIQRIRSKIQLDLIPFQYKEYHFSKIIDQNNEIKKHQQLNYSEVLKIVAYTNTGNQLVSTIISYFATTDIASFMLILITMNKLSNAISNLTSFTTQLNWMKNDYSNLEDFWKDEEFKSEPEKLFPSNDLFVTNVYYEIKDTTFKVQLASDCGKISLAAGEKIYVHGPTGDGKSTFIKLLLGQIEGATMNIGKAENYYHHVADYFQQIKEKMPSSKISIRDYFKGEKDDSIIERYLMRVFKAKELTRIKEVLLAQKDEYDSNSEILLSKPKSVYDIEINEKISGGQKSRLILTMRGYETDINGKGIIVLDEPCPDVDHDTYTEILNDFFDHYKRCTIIMVGHLCACKKASLRVEWTQQFTVKNGFVSRD